jgi:hypothetical protein
VVAGEFVVCACKEVVALGVVLTDEEDEGWLGAASGLSSLLASRRRCAVGELALAGELALCLADGGVSGPDPGLDLAFGGRRRRASSRRSFFLVSDGWA